MISWGTRTWEIDVRDSCVLRRTLRGRVWLPDDSFSAHLRMMATITRSKSMEGKHVGTQRSSVGLGDVSSEVFRG